MILIVESAMTLLDKDLLQVFSQTRLIQGLQTLITMEMESVAQLHDIDTEFLEVILTRGILVICNT